MTVNLAKRPTAVYRFYDTTDALLYVGITEDLLSRWAWHQRNSTWWPRAKRSVHWRDTRALAAREELRAIRGEGAVHNRAGRGKTIRRTVRCPDDLWDRFGAAAEQAGSNRTAVLRACVRWYLGHPGAELPERPIAEPAHDAH